MKRQRKCFLNFGLFSLCDVEYKVLTFLISALIESNGYYLTLFHIPMEEISEVPTYRRCVKLFGTFAGMLKFYRLSKI